MPAEINMVRPAFKISLTAAESLEMGRLALVWGQVDHLIMMAVTNLLTVDANAGAIVTKEMTTGPLLGLLRKSLPLIKDEKTRKIAAKFCKDMNSLIEYRNHITHGMWGWFITDGNPANAKPACLYMKDPRRELFPDRITTTANKAAEQSHKIYKVVKALYDLPEPDPTDPYPRYFFTKNEQVRTPEGLTLKSL